MANENETVEQICEELVDCGAVEIAYRITEAHKREIADIREKCMHQATVIAEGKDEYIEWLKRELAAKDEEIAKRDALIKELADELNKIVESDDGICDCNCGKEYECPNKSTICFPHIRELIKKAREEVKE